MPLRHALIVALSGWEKCSNSFIACSVVIWQVPKNTLACNYDYYADYDDGSCEFESCAGCMVQCKYSHE